MATPAQERSRRRRASPLPAPLHRSGPPLSDSPPLRRLDSPRPVAYEDRLFANREWQNLRPRLHHALLVTTGMAAALSGCAPQQAATEAAAPPNPYGYLQPARVCIVGKGALPPQGPASTTLSVTNDGYCALHYARPSGGPFASFLVTEVPHHGDPLIYNYNEQTVVTYTASAGYVGPDSMTVEFIPAPGAPRTVLHVAITVSVAPGTPRS